MSIDWHNHPFPDLISEDKAAWCLRELVEHARQWFEETGEVRPGFEFKSPERRFKIDFNQKGDTATE